VRTTPVTRPTSEPPPFQVREDGRALSASSRRLSQSAQAERAPDELTILVREKLIELGASSVRFTIRSVPYEEPNWRIDTARLRRDEQLAVTAVSVELGSQYDLGLDDRSSPDVSAVSTLRRYSIRRRRAPGSSLVKRALMVAALSVFTEASAAEPLDLRGLPTDLMACKPAALRLCDRAHGYTAAALRKCGATLAARVQEVGQGCSDVLKRYGQL
jgi:hypothetical protein